MEACFLGLRLDVRELERRDAIVTSPLTIRVGKDGFAVLFRYGVVVFVNLNLDERLAFKESVAPYVEGAFDDPETDTLSVIRDEKVEERIGPEGALHLVELSL